MELEDKESAKAFFGFSQVPFCVVSDYNGVILAAGEPKSIDIHLLLSKSESAEYAPLSDGTSESLKVAIDSLAIDENVSNKATTHVQPVFVLDEDF
jgi:hypothetical protein